MASKAEEEYYSSPEELCQVLTIVTFVSSLPSLGVSYSSIR